MEIEAKKEVRGKEAWEVRFDVNGYLFYYERGTGEKQWKRPKNTAVKIPRPNVWVSIDQQDPFLNFDFMKANRLPGKLKTVHKKKEDIWKVRMKDDSLMEFHQTRLTRRPKTPPRVSNTLSWSDVLCQAFSCFQSSWEEELLKPDVGAWPEHPLEPLPKSQPLKIKGNRKRNFSVTFFTRPLLLALEFNDEGGGEWVVTRTYSRELLQNGFHGRFTWTRLNGKAVRGFRMIDELKRCDLPLQMGFQRHLKCVLCHNVMSQRKFSKIGRKKKQCHQCLQRKKKKKNRKSKKQPKRVEFKIRAGAELDKMLEVKERDGKMWVTKVLHKTMLKRGIIVGMKVSLEVGGFSSLSDLVPPVKLIFHVEEPDVEEWFAMSDDCFSEEKCDEFLADRIIVTEKLATFRGCLDKAKEMVKADTPILIFPVFEELFRQVTQVTRRKYDAKASHVGWKYFATVVAASLPHCTPKCRDMLNRSVEIRNQIMHGYALSLGELDDQDFDFQEFIDSVLGVLESYYWVVFESEAISEPEFMELEGNSVDEKNQARM